MRANIGSRVAILLIGVMFVPSTAFAEQAGPRTGSRTLATVAAEHAAKKQADRQTVLNVLDRQEVRKVAKQAGLRIDKAAAAVATLDGAELAQVVEQAQLVDDALAGGGSAGGVITTVVFLVVIFIILGNAAMADFGIS